MVISTSTCQSAFDYTFTYTAIDDCGNKGECSVEVEVEDKQGPVVICESFHVVALTDSVTIVFATAFDDGSYDECTMITFDARRGTMNSQEALERTHATSQVTSCIHQQYDSTAAMHRVRSSCLLTCASVMRLAMQTTAW